MSWGPYRGRIPYVNEEDIVSYGKDDITGLPIMVDDMVPVMQYFGSQVQWTGFYTHKDKVDIPQPQLAPAWLQPDPQPSPIIRILGRPMMPPIPTGLTINAITDSTIQVTWDSVPVATSYTLQWTSPVVQNPIPNIAITNTPTVSYEITDLAPHTYYLVQVATTYSEATSAYSNAVAATTL